MAFDVITPVKMGQNQLDVTPAMTVLRTTPGDSVDIIKTIDIANSGVVRASVSVFLVPNGGVADGSNILIPNINVEKNSIVQWSGVQVSDAGGTIEAQSSIFGVCMTVSGGNGV